MSSLETPASPKLHHYATGRDDDAGTCPTNKGFDNVINNAKTSTSGDNQNELTTTLIETLVLTASQTKLGKAVDEWIDASTTHAGKWAAAEADDAGRWFQAVTEDKSKWEETANWVKTTADDTGTWLRPAADGTGKWIVDTADGAGKWADGAAQGVGNLFGFWNRG
ncbi:hypothetical protein CDD80_6764 [Ophiocordyceps camponoti-rufipedis]|uniref:Uncharacterized protein n=1 Tax=Ophiocordyceps camponoti-rufipedis TaxID=2004952 RepID=A0A2C5ZEP5_9HYPO|nr:hypothetical protein CDD80_6764 [Ophiocordyceps camponoti-rufipedis]